MDITTLVQEALSRASVPGLPAAPNAARAANVEVVSHLDEKVPALVADPDQLSRVFGNIIGNAIQAMPEGGQLTVRSEVESAEWLAVSFMDTGMGIPKEELGKVFEPLFTTKAKGIGLGLALTKILVDGHGGTIEVESEVGKGTVFTIKLPISGK